MPYWKIFGSKSFTRWLLGLSVIGASPITWHDDTIMFVHFCRLFCTVSSLIRSQWLGWICLMHWLLTWKRKPAKFWGQAGIFGAKQCYHRCLSVHRGAWLPSMYHRSHDWGSASREYLPNPPVGRPQGSASSGVCPTLLDADSLGCRPPGGRPPGPPWDTMGYSQQVGSTHPTGMHSCFHCF